MEKEEAKRFSILMFPWLAHGHIFPFLELAKRLSKRHFTIYFCSTATNLDPIKTNIAKDPSVLEGSIKLVELAIESAQLPQELHTTKNLPSHLIPILIQDYQKSSSSFFDIFNSLNPDLLIFDFFQPWAAKHALSHRTPSVCFVTTGATLCSFYHHEYTHKTSSPFPYRGIYLLDEERVDFRSRLSVLIKDADRDSFAFGSFNLSSEIILLKTSKGLEEKYIDYLSVLCDKQIVPTGPLVVHSNEEDSEIMQFLNGKNERSVVYVSFGSEFFLSNEQIVEVAKGLELCNVNFIWIIRFPEGENNNMTFENALPQGFLERVNGRGMVVWKFAPQTSILAHKSIGGFVSHCGWSSVMESVYFGVPIIAMPMKSEQPVNGRMVVEVGVGIEVGKDGSGRYLGKEVARAIDKVVVDKESSEGMRGRAKNLSDTIRESEEQELDEVADQLMRLCRNNKLIQV